MSEEIVEDPVGDLDKPDESNDTDPLPELGSMEEQQDEVSPVEHVGVVKCLEMPTAPVIGPQLGFEMNCNDLDFT